MNYEQKRRDVLRSLKKDGGVAVFERRLAEGGLVRFSGYVLRIERRIGDKKMFDESVEIGDYKYIAEGSLNIREGDLITCGGETRVIMRVEEFKPVDLTIFWYIWSRTA